MIIPADAVVFDQNGVHVAVVENGTVHLQKITIARDFGTEVEVHDGVKPARLLVPSAACGMPDLVRKLQVPVIALLHASVAPRRAAR